MFVRYLMVLNVCGIFYCSAYDILSKGKSTNQFPTWPCVDVQTCRRYESHNAVDGNTKSCMRTDVINARPKTFTWWYVDLGGIKSIYSVRILFSPLSNDDKLRQNGRFAGFSLYLSNTTDKFKEEGYRCYLDGPELPPLDFNATCIGHGRYILYYNQRLPEGQYLEGYPDGYPDGFRQSSITELCEVDVQGCEKSGMYGKNCNIECPENCQEKRCRILDGTCLGCKPGWFGDLCGKGWPCVRHCKDNASCDHVTGHCNRCAAGWTGTLCDKECLNWTYGENCMFNCSGHCLHKYPCNKMSGKCVNGCSPGYTNQKCDQECESGYFGNKCAENCSTNCQNKNKCNYITGICESGCKDGYVGEKCNEACSHDRYGPNCSKICSSTCSNHSCSNEDGKCRYGCEWGYQGSNCIEITVAEKDKHALLLEVSVGAGSFFLILLISAYLLIRARCKSGKHRRLVDQEEMIELQTIAQRKSTIRNRRTILSESIEWNGAPLCAVDPFANDQRGSFSRLNKTISIKDLQKTIAKMSKYEDAGFKREYKQIRKGKLYPYDEATRPENIQKNRYKAIYPYDHSRVILESLTPDETDYINANYIEDIEEELSYIATQGPKENTMFDFWSMVWQEYVRVIVCLTNLTDGIKVKCAQYWPNANEIMKIGHFTIRTKTEEVYANYTIRRIYVKKSQKELMVIMCHYTEWKDQGVPEPLNLVIFHRHVLKITDSYRGYYILVHCSAGIGRTGTFIALDALYREVLKSGKINVPKYVETMRRNRVNMIQTWNQYKIVYLALCESFSGTSRPYSPKGFLKQHLKTNVNCRGNLSESPLYMEFEELIRVRKRYTSDDFLTGHETMYANDTAPVFPLKKYACQLAYTKERETYYNAVLLQSFTSNDCLISAPFPLLDNTEAFLRLLKDFKVHIVIFTCPLRDVASSTKWFPFNKKKKKIGSFKIEFTDSTPSRKFTSTDIVLRSKGCLDMNLKVIEFTSWREELSSTNHKVLLDVVKQTVVENIQADSKLLVLSSDGAKRCGPFFVVFNAVQQLFQDKELDIFLITRLLQIRRPEFISTWEEYEFCNSVLADYIQSGLVYVNSRYRSIRNTLVSFIR